MNDDNTSILDVFDTGQVFSWSAYESNLNTQGLTLTQSVWYYSNDTVINYYDLPTQKVTMAYDFHPDGSAVVTQIDVQQNQGWGNVQTFFSSGAHLTDQVVLGDTEDKTSTWYDPMNSQVSAQIYFGESGATSIAFDTRNTSVIQSISNSYAPDNRISAQSVSFDDGDWASISFNSFGVAVGIGGDGARAEDLGLRSGSFSFSSDGINSALANMNADVVSMNMTASAAGSIGREITRGLMTTLDWAGRATVANDIVKGTTGVSILGSIADWLSSLYNGTSGAPAGPPNPANYPTYNASIVAIGGGFDMTGYNSISGTPDIGPLGSNGMLGHI